MDIQLSIFISNQLRATRTVSVPCVIGRSRQADLTIGHPVVSRRHCELFYENGEMKLRDCGSLNGTHFRGEIVSGSVVLHPGDAIRIGELTLVVNFQEQGNPHFGMVGPTPKSVPTLSSLSDSSSALAPPSSLDIIDLANFPGIGIVPASSPVPQPIPNVTLNGSGTSNTQAPTKIAPETQVTTPYHNSDSDPDLSL